MTVPDQSTRSVARRGPSIGDVAREAGVSPQTVSRVSTGRERVEPATRRRVEQAMKRLGYRPNNAARALRSGRFSNIGVIMFTLSSFGNMRTLDAIAVACADAGYSMTLIPARHSTQDDVSMAFARLAEKSVDGVIIIIEAHLLNEADVELAAGLPLVVIDSSAHYAYPVIDNDQAEGARLATEHLLELGHETVWHVSGPESSFSAQRRRDSWAATLVASGARVPEVIVGDWSSDSGYAAGLVLAADVAVTAIFAANDQMALGILRAAHERGRSVPGDLSVVGFDDMAESSSFWPPLTTVHQHFEVVGKRTVEALVDEIEGRPSGHGNDLVATRLVVRESSGPPPVP